MNRTSIEKRAQIIGAMVEGNSLRSIVRMTGTAMNTLLKLLADVGQASFEYQSKTMRNLSCKRVQCDEIWQFCYAKDKNVPADKQGQFGFGSVWTWVAICADTKIVPSWMIGGRDAATAYVFMQDLASRLSNRIQLTTDGHKVYVNAVEAAFGADIDYAMLVKMYGNDAEAERATAPPHALGVKLRPSLGYESNAHLHKLRGAPEPNDANVYAPIHPPHEWILEESRESGAFGCSALHVVQRRSRSQDFAGDASNGSGSRGSRLEL